MRGHICLKAEYKELFETKTEMGEQIQSSQPPLRTSGSGDMMV